MRFVLFLGLFVAGKVMAAVPGVTNFELRDPKTKEVYFTGSEKVTVDGKDVVRETSYFDSAKKEVQKESFAYDSESLKAGVFSSLNSLTGEESKVSSKEKGYEVSYKENKDEAATTAVVGDAFLPNSAADLILANWDKLLANKAVRFPLLVASRGEVVPFQLLRRDTVTVDGEVREVFTLMPQNMLIRLLAPHLEFQFTKEKKMRMAVFPSSLPIKGAKDKMVEMVVK